MYPSKNHVNTHPVFVSLVKWKKLKMIIIEVMIPIVVSETKMVIGMRRFCIKNESEADYDKDKEEVVSGGGGGVVVMIVWMRIMIQYMKK